jgi:hypothetical protein
MDRETLEALIEDIKIVDNLDLPMSASPNVSVNDSRWKYPRLWLFIIIFYKIISLKVLLIGILFSPRNLMNRVITIVNNNPNK